MSTTSSPTQATTFMVVATIRANTQLAELAALRADEEKQLEMLHSNGRIGVHHISPARRTAFLEVIAPDEEHVVKMLATLPFAKFFDLDVYPTASPDTGS